MLMATLPLYGSFTSIPTLPHLIIYSIYLSPFTQAPLLIYLYLYPLHMISLKRMPTSYVAINMEQRKYILTTPSLLPYRWIFLTSRELSSWPQK